MQKPRVRVYTDYKSPYAFVANQRLFELEENHGVELEWLPYTLRIAEFMGTVEERTPHFWRKVRYTYMDARRFAVAVAPFSAAPPRSPRSLDPSRPRQTYCIRTGRLSGPRKPNPCQRTLAGSGRIMLGKRSNSMGSRMTPTVRRDSCAPAQ